MKKDNIKQAEAKYHAILRKNPRDIDALHALGIFNAQKENFADAIKYLQLAIKYQPDNSILQLHLANVLKAQGLFDQAASVLQKILTDNPGYSSALNNLGTVFYAQERYSDAIEAFSSVIKKEPQYIDAYYNLGLALNKKNLLDEAEKTYRKLLDLSPEHFAARFHLACILMQKTNIDDALLEFLKIEKSAPLHFETQCNIAACFLKKGDLNFSKTHYLKALDIMPKDKQILFNLGVIYTQQGNIDSAIQNYQKAVQQDPDFFAAHNNLGVAFLAKQHVAFALHHFQEAARLQPDNSSIQYTIQALSQNQRLLSAPTDYIKSLFDAYADHYEQHLLTALDYKIPAHLKRMINITRPHAVSLNILDLGCGTGLCGEILKPLAKTLTGVDLSKKMLDAADIKKIYDVLCCDELNSFLSKKHNEYDLIVAGDVLVYIGELTALFQHVQHALRVKGSFAFNTEISENDDYQMNQSGRFAHQKKYIELLAKENNLVVAHYEQAITRMQNNEPVYGHLYVLMRVS
ncbi:MAG TPA: tetratricopeptide repeat protein [Gammaproteobacteria bacterium]|nr:tetratricopeptide repeat protein [Gammaproteobacteria bacterium]